MKGRDLGRDMGRSLTSQAGFDPASLAYDLWDADRPDTLTLIGSSISEWRSVRNGYPAVQSAGASRPVFSASAWRGWRPGLTFDGVDDVLECLGGNSFPAGADAGEIWALIDQGSAPADANVRHAFGYGSNSGTGSVRALRRAVAAGLNQATAFWFASGAANVIAAAPGDFSGRSVLRGQFGPTEGAMSRNGEHGAAVAGVPATGSGLIRIGAFAGSTNAANFFKGVISLIAVTPPLTPDEATQMTAYLISRGGIA